METPKSPADLFNMPPIVLPKVSLDQVLNMLRKRINKSYMPSATGEREFNSKPQYIPHESKEIAKMPSVHPHEPTGYFALTDHFGYTEKNYAIWCHIQIGEFQIMVNLKTDETWVKAFDFPEPLIRWEQHPDQTLPINPYELEEILDIYL